MIIWYAWDTASLCIQEYPCGSLLPFILAEMKDPGLLEVPETRGLEVYTELARYSNQQVPTIPVPLEPLCLDPEGQASPHPPPSFWPQATWSPKWPWANLSPSEPHFLHLWAQSWTQWSGRSFSVQILGFFFFCLIVVFKYSLYTLQPFKSTIQWVLLYLQICTTITTVSFRTSWTSQKETWYPLVITSQLHLRPYKQY